MSGRPVKEFHEYLTEASDSHVSHDDYLKSPATAFLKYTVEAKSAIDLCVRKLPRNSDGMHSKDSRDSLQHLIVAMLPAIMSHFETFQKYLFAGMFDSSVFLRNFSVVDFFKALDRNSNKALCIDLERLSAYRGIGATSIGSLVADNLSGWHSPETVNRYFNAFKLNRCFFSNTACSAINVLWQLRHSIVHTGGTLTLPDAQKVSELSSFGNRQLAFENNFIFEVCRKFHPIIKSATQGIGDAYLGNLVESITDPEKREIITFFEVKSSINVWF